MSQPYLHFLIMKLRWTGDRNLHDSFPTVNRRRKVLCAKDPSRSGCGGPRLPRGGGPNLRRPQNYGESLPLLQVGVVLFNHGPEACRSCEDHQPHMLVWLGSRTFPLRLGTGSPSSSWSHSVCTCTHGADSVGCFCGRWGHFTTPPAGT